MLRYALNRVLGAIPTLLLVIALAFLMVHAAPGGPFDNERIADPKIIEAIEKTYGLDEPIYVQFANYVGGLLTGDLGPSYRYRGQGVAELIGGALPVSLALGLLAITVAIAAGVAAGVFAAIRRGSFLDRAVMAVAMTGISIPVFVVAPLLVLLLSVSLDWLPAGWSGNEGAARWILPVFALALPQVAYIARLMRASMIEVLGSDFVRTARSLGLGTAAVVRRHALKPALLPVVSYLGPAIAAILTGSVVVEQVFGIPGLGQLFVLGAGNRDYTLVLGVVILYAALVIALNLVVDIAYGVIDPRIRRR